MARPRFRVLPVLLAALASATTFSAVAPAATMPAMVDASPSRVVLTDATRDVRRFWYPFYAGDFVGTRPAADITRAGIRHGAKAIDVRLHFVNLRATARAQSVWVMINTPRDKADFIDGLFFRPGNRAGTWQDGCRGIQHTVRYARDVIELQVPRACLGDPAWVQVKITEQMCAHRHTGRTHPASPTTLTTPNAHSPSWLSVRSRNGCTPAEVDAGLGVLIPAGD
jgi:hypothetical protein